MDREGAPKSAVEMKDEDQTGFRWPVPGTRFPRKARDKGFLGREPQTSPPGIQQGWAGPVTLDDERQKHLTKPGANWGRAPVAFPERPMVSKKPDKAKEDAPKGAAKVQRRISIRPRVACGLLRPPKAHREHLAQLQQDRDRGEADHDLRPKGPEEKT